LAIARRFQGLSKIGFDPQAVGLGAGNVKGAYMRGPGGGNALPSVMAKKPESETGAEAFGFPDIKRNPACAYPLLAKNVDA